MTLLKDLSKTSQNPRTITPDRADALRASLEEFGDLSGIIFNRKMKQIVGGHQRKALHPEAEVMITKRFDPPTETGTVAVGYVAMPNGERHGYREVHWTEAKHLAAMVAANKHGGEWDRGPLAEVLVRIDELNFPIERTGFQPVEIENLVAPTRIGFGQGTAEEQGRLDEKAGEKTVMTCPHCNGQFTR